MNYIPLSRAGNEYLKSLRNFEQIKHEYLKLDFYRANSCNLDLKFITMDEPEIEKIKRNDLDEAIM